MQRKAAPQLHSALGHGPADKRIELLRRVGEAGSISQAARLAGVSYKAAWQAIDTLGNLAGVDVVERVVGGAGGGGAVLSDAGRQLLAAAEEIEQARAAVLGRIASLSGSAVPAARAAALGLRTSMRNQFPCHVESLTKEGAAVRVRLALPDGTVLTSSITRESAQLLDLRRGQAVLALCKATAVRVVPSARAAPGRNLLRGLTTRVSRAAAGEVALALPSRLQVVGFSSGDRPLALRAPAVAIIQESALVIALAS